MLYYACPLTLSMALKCAENKNDWRAWRSTGGQASISRMSAFSVRSLELATPLECVQSPAPLPALIPNLPRVCSTFQRIKKKKKQAKFSQWFFFFVRIIGEINLNLEFAQATHVLNGVLACVCGCGCRCELTVHARILTYLFQGLCVL